MKARDAERKISDGHKTESLPNDDDIKTHGTTSRIAIEDNCILLNKAYPYYIELHRINTPGKLLEWVHHLSGKYWVDGRLIRQLIDVVYNHFKWKKALV